MTPEELDAIEARYGLTDDAVDWHSESDVWETAAQVPDLVAALREAWAALDRVMWTCPECAFTYAAEHRDPFTEAYACPVCEETRLRSALDRVRLFRDQCAADTGIEVTFTRQDVAAHLTAALEGES